MSQAQAKQDALQRAIERLKPVDVPARVKKIGLPDPHEGKLEVELLGRIHHLDLETWDLTLKGQDQPAAVVDALFLLHYLLIDVPYVPGDEWVTYRSFPGGAFYWPSYLARSTKPLLQYIGNDRERLKKGLERLRNKPCHHPNAISSLPA